jgi:hypothetical protein
MADGYGCKLSELELEPTADKGYGLVCFVKKTLSAWNIKPKPYQLGWSVTTSVEPRFHIHATKAVMQLIVDLVETPKKLLEDHWDVSQHKIKTLKHSKFYSIDPMFKTII